MADELGWSRSQQRQQIESAVSFLSSMGLAPDSAVIPEPKPRGLLERAESALWRVRGVLVGMGTDTGGKGRPSVVYSRAQFEAREVEALRNAFRRRAKAVVSREPSGVGLGGVEERQQIRKDELVEVLKEVPGYEDVAAKDCEYVLEEAGFNDRNNVDFDEFIEVRLTACFVYSKTLMRCQFSIDLWNPQRGCA
jgi:glycerol-3-phosphate dehydrogenase